MVNSYAAADAGRYLPIHHLRGQSCCWHHSCAALLLEDGSLDLRGLLLWLIGQASLHAGKLRATAYCSASASSSSRSQIARSSSQATRRAARFSFPFDATTAVALCLKLACPLGSAINLSSPPVCGLDTLSIGHRGTEEDGANMASRELKTLAHSFLALNKRFMSMLSRDAGDLLCIWVLCEYWTWPTLPKWLHVTELLRCVLRVHTPSWASG